MTMQSYDQLREPDRRTLAFLSHGLGIGLAMRPERSVQYWQEVIEGYQLESDVAEGTRRSFEDLTTAFVYGVLCYEIFTLVDSQAQLVLEQALRDRFVDHHNGTVVFKQRNDTHRVTVDSYRDVLVFLRENRRPKPRLCVSDDPDVATIEFDGMLKSLLRWARSVGLLAGQRNRVVESAMSELRNGIAHPTAYRLVSPVTTSRTLRDLAEMVNRLWGHPTPGGRLYPGPFDRFPVAIAWNPVDGKLCTALATNLTEPSEWDPYTRFAIVQSVWADSKGHQDPQLEQYDSLYETTPYPTDYLWGPGTYDQALTWLTSTQPASDTCISTDRQFLIRTEPGIMWQPMRPTLAANLPNGATTGTWHLVNADTPLDALRHVQQVIGGSTDCTATDSCPNCPAETITQGSFDHVLAKLGISRASHRVLPPDFAVSIPEPIARSVLLLP